jgi:hypothetical protein
MVMHIELNHLRLQYNGRIFCKRAETLNSDQLFS